MESPVGVQIPLTMILMGHSDRVDMICLQTNIAVSAETEEEAIGKMKDATILYFGSFSPAELIAGKYKRSAPLQYHLQGLLMKFIHNWRKMKRADADYDQSGNNLRFA